MDYLPRFWTGASVLELSNAQAVGDQHDLWPWPLTYWPEYQKGSSFEASGAKRFWGKAFLSYQLQKLWETNMTFDLELLTWISIGITKVKGYRHTDRPTYQHVQSNMPFFIKRGGGGVRVHKYKSLTSTCSKVVAKVKVFFNCRSKVTVTRSLTWCHLKGLH